MGSLHEGQFNLLKRDILLIDSSNKLIIHSLQKKSPHTNVYFSLISPKHIEQRSFFIFCTFFGEVNEILLFDFFIADPLFFLFGRKAKFVKSEKYLLGKYNICYLNNNTEDLIEDFDKENINTDTNDELAEILNVTRRTVLRDVDKLKQQGLIVRIGPDKGGHWKVTEQVANK